MTSQRHALAFSLSYSLVSRRKNSANTYNYCSFLEMYILYTTRQNRTEHNIYLKTEIIEPIVMF